MIHSFNLNNEEEQRFQQIVAKEKHKSESAIIRQRLFRRRERNQIQLTVVDVQFLSTLSNVISSAIDNHKRGNDVDDELIELQKLVEEKMNVL